MSTEHAQGAGEFRFNSPETGLFTGRTFSEREVKFSPIEDLAFFEGDIILGTVRDLQGGLEAIAIRGDAFRWPSATVFYRIAESLPHPERVEQAIKHWQDHTPIRFKERTATDKDFVTFQPGAGCSSFVGRRGGEQSITLGSACTAGNAIHEIGHTVGLWHEQSRSDRDQFITIDLKNIIAAAIHNFDQQLTDGDDIGAYDYESIMHYPANAFAKDPSRPTITPKQAGAQIGQRTHLSAGDIAAVKSLYPS
jgi:hypothetical protein